MDVKLPEEIGRRMGEKALRDFGVEERAFSFQKWTTIDLGRWPRPKIERFRALVAEHAGNTRGGGVLLRDVDAWLEATAGGTGVKARTVEHFGSLLREVLRQAPGHRVYSRNDKVSAAWLAYYVARTEYEPERMGTSSRDRVPPHVTMTIVWEEFGGRKKRQVVFWQDDCRGMTVEQALAGEGFYLETPDMRAAYLAEVERFEALAPQVGLQCFATGVGFDDLDGNGRRGSDAWWYYRSSGVRLDRDGMPARVVVDVFREDEREEREEKVHVDRWFWGASAEGDEEEAPDGLGRRRNFTEVKPAKRGGKDDVRDELPAADVDADPPMPEIPVHPLLAVFDLARHLRMRCHVSCVTEYEYDRKLHERLILPLDIKALVHMLLSGATSFRDIVEGKSGGSIIMCAGSPGTGKTLTAQVYAESMGRPLYSVQAAQLGLNPEELENELLKVFARAQRWGAVLLVDEADVYVRERDNDLRQNAIVGVLLRVLEHYAGVLFLTTNRASTVDDAVASRCLARIDYEVPSKAEQARIWRVLAVGADIDVSYDVIEEVVAAHPGLSGRDVKNLLKLASLVADVTGEPISAATVAFVKRFKPTKGKEAPTAEPAAPAPEALLALAQGRGRVRRTPERAAAVEEGER